MDIYLGIKICADCLCNKALSVKAINVKGGVTFSFAITLAEIFFRESSKSAQWHILIFAASRAPGIQSMSALSS